MIRKASLTRYPSLFVGAGTLLFGALSPQAAHADIGSTVELQGELRIQTEGTLAQDILSAPDLKCEVYARSSQDPNLEAKTISGNIVSTESEVVCAYTLSVPVQAQAQDYDVRATWTYDAQWPDYRLKNWNYRFAPKSIALDTSSVDPRLDFSGSAEGTSIFFSKDCSLIQAADTVQVKQGLMIPSNFGTCQNMNRLWTSSSRCFDHLFGFLPGRDEHSFIAQPGSHEFRVDYSVYNPALGMDLSFRADVNLREFGQERFCIEVPTCAYSDDPECRPATDLIGRVGVLGFTGRQVTQVVLRENTDLAPNIRTANVDGIGTLPWQVQGLTSSLQWLDVNLRLGEGPKSAYVDTAAKDITVISDGPIAELRDVLPDSRAPLAFRPGYIQGQIRLDAGDHPKALETWSTLVNDAQHRTPDRATSGSHVNTAMYLDNQVGQAAVSIETDLQLEPARLQTDYAIPVLSIANTPIDAATPSLDLRFWSLAPLRINEAKPGTTLPDETVVALPEPDEFRRGRVDIRPNAERRELFKVSPGQRTREDFNLCFATVQACVELDDKSPFFNPQLNFQGSAASGKHDVSANFWGTPYAGEDNVEFGKANAEAAGQVSLVLPAGNYQWTPSVQSGDSQIQFAAQSISLGCNEFKQIPVVQDTTFEIQTAACQASGDQKFRIDVHTSDIAPQDVTLVVNGGSPEVLCGGPGTPCSASPSFERVYRNTTSEETTSCQPVELVVEATVPDLDPAQANSACAKAASRQTFLLGDGPNCELPACEPMSAPALSPRHLWMLCFGLLAAGLGFAWRPAKQRWA